MYLIGHNGGQTDRFASRNNDLDGVTGVELAVELFSQELVFNIPLKYSSKECGD